MPSAQTLAAQNAVKPPPPPPRTTDRLSTGHSRSRPPYFDPSTGMRYDTNNGSYEGWLTKQSEWLKDWRRRWFILKGDKLFFAKSNFSVPHGMVDLSKCQTVKSAEHKAGKKYAMEVQSLLNPIHPGNPDQLSTPLLVRMMTPRVISPINPNSQYTHHLLSTT